jgi:low affinity Fe/Cu permease
MIGSRPEVRMSRRRPGALGPWFEEFSTAVTRWTGSSTAFGLAGGVIVVWAVLGPVFGFSDTWQLVINTGTTIVTFLMVFLIQRAQNKDALALQLKLNELVAAVEGASNRLIDIEDLSEEELETLHKYYQRLVIMAKKDAALTKSHSVEEAEHRHSAKIGSARGRQ